MTEQSALPTLAEKVTAADVCAALHRRYNKPSQGREGEQYVCIEEARSGAGFNGNDGRCDLLAINTWQSRGMELIGHEVKVSMSDWKAELANPEKAERFARFCRRWYIAVPNDLATKIKHEVPPTWGLLSVSAKGTCREVIAAPSRDPEAVPSWWFVGWLAQIDRQHKRGMARHVEERMAEEREKLNQRIDAEVIRRRERAEQRDSHLKDNVAALKSATGIDLANAWPDRIERLGKLWAVTTHSYDLDALAGTLRRSADALDELASVQTAQHLTESQAS